MDKDEPLGLLIKQSVRRRTLQDKLEVKLTDEQYHNLRIFADRVREEYGRDPYLEEYKTALEIIGTNVKVRRKNIRRFQVERRVRLEEIMIRRYKVPKFLLQELSNEIEDEFDTGRF